MWTEYLWIGFLTAVMCYGLCSISGCATGNTVNDRLVAESRVQR